MTTTRVGDTTVSESYVAKEGRQVTAIVDISEVDVQKKDVDALDKVKVLTGMIRQHQRDIERLSRERRSVIMRLRDHRITYREIAEAMGTTEQNVYKILRDYIAEQNARAEQ